MYEKIRENLIQYEVVINRWPQYSLILEHVSSHLNPKELYSLSLEHNHLW